MGPILVKLGGSVVTRKKEESTLRPKVVTRLGQELAEGWTKAGRPGMVVVHGAGSFGHPYAHKWALHLPPPGPRPGRERGAAVTGYQVRVLHTRILKSLVEAGLPAFSVPPSPVALNREGYLDHLDAQPFATALGRGMVPVTFGDVVHDAAWGFSILSGDTIMLELARSLKADRALFVSDVDGLLEGGEPQKLLSKVTEDSLARLSPKGGAPDVTGGIVGKAHRMLELSQLGVPTGLLNGLREGRLSSAVAGGQVRGSWT